MLTLPNLNINFIFTLLNSIPLDYFCFVQYLAKIGTMNHSATNNYANTA